MGEKSGVREIFDGTRSWKRLKEKKLSEERKAREFAPNRLGHLSKIAEVTSVPQGERVWFWRFAKK